MSESNHNQNQQVPRRQSTIVIQTPNTRRSVICLENQNVNCVSTESLVASDSALTKASTKLNSKTSTNSKTE